MRITRLSEEHRQAIRDGQRRARWCCPRCGGATEDVSGEELLRRTLGQGSYFAGITYRTCNGCGWEGVVRTRRER